MATKGLLCPDLIGQAIPCKLYLTEFIRKFEVGSGRPQLRNIEKVNDNMLDT